MKKRLLSKFLMSSLLAMMVLILMPTTASYAVGGSSVSIEVGQVFTIFGTDAKPDTKVKYDFVAKDDAPAPAEASGKEYAFMLEGDDQKIINLSYEHAGVYEYLLSSSGTGGEGYTYDNEEYIIRVYVKNTESGGLASELLAEKKDGSKSYNKKSKDGDNFQIEDLEIFENVAYVMAYHADSTIPKSIDEWLDQFDIFSIYQVLPEILELWGENMMTEVQAKKGLAEVSAK